MDTSLRPHRRPVSLGHLRNGLRFLAKHRNETKKAGDDAALILPAGGAMKANPNPHDVFENVKAGLRVTGALAEGQDGADSSA